MLNSRTVLLLLSLVSLICLFIFSGWTFPFTTDSMIYVSTAQQIKAGTGFVSTNFFIDFYSGDYLPTALEPPGFPLLISILSFFGTNEYISGILLPRLCFLALPFLFFTIFRRMMNEGVAVIASFICAFAFPVIMCSLMVWTEIPYLFLSLLSVCIAFHIIDSNGQKGTLFLFMAGVIAGYAFFTRYVGLMLIVSICAGFLLGFVLRVITLKNFGKIILLYALGTGLVVVPYLLRNLVEFHHMQPVHFPPSRVTLSENVGDYFQGLAQFIFATHSFDKVIVAILFLFIIFLVLQGKKWIQKDNKLFICVFILIAYFISYSVFLISYKTVYYISEEIAERYLVQVAWILMGGIVFAVSMGLKKLSNFRLIDVKSVTGFLLMAFVLIQVFPVVDHYFFHKNIKDLSFKIKQAIPVVKNLPPDFVIVSNVADITYYFAKRNVRMLAGYTPYGAEKILGSNRRFVVLLAKNGGLLSKDWEYATAWQWPYGYIRIYSDDDIECLMPHEFFEQLNLLNQNL